MKFFSKESVRERQGENECREIGLNHSNVTNLIYAFTLVMNDVIHFLGMKYNDVQYLNA